jgi:uncharacterized protein (DUF4415 family)
MPTSKENITRVTLAEAKRMKGETDWARLDAMTDDDIARAVANDPHAPPIDIDWDKASLVVPATAKDVITLRLDHDVLKWLRSTGKGYQTRINKVLRAWYEATRREAELRNAELRAAPKRAPDLAQAVIRHELDAIEKARAKRAAKKPAAKRATPAKKRA